MIINKIFPEIAYKYNLSIQKELQNICAPLFNAFGIKSFRYGKLFNNGNFNMLNSDEKSSGFMFNSEANGEAFEQAINSTQINQFYYFL